MRPGPFHVRHQEYYVLRQEVRRFEALYLQVTKSSILQKLFFSFCENAPFNVFKEFAKSRRSVGHFAVHPTRSDFRHEIFASLSPNWSYSEFLAPPFHDHFSRFCKQTLLGLLVFSTSELAPLPLKTRIL